MIRNAKFGCFGIKIKEIYTIVLWEKIPKVTFLTETILPES